MPYISKKGTRRQELRNGEPALTAGELNYQIFYYVKHCDYNCPECRGHGMNNIDDYGVQCKKCNRTGKRNSNQFISDIMQFTEAFLRPNVCYQRYNDLTGCLVRCRKEIERRLKIYDNWLGLILLSYDKEIEKYEDKKIKENSDVE